MGTPIILAANVYEAPKLLKQGATLGPMAVLSGVVAGVVAYASLAFLMRYFHRHEFEALSPFAYYCWAAGAMFLAIITLSLNASPGLGRASERALYWQGQGRGHARRHARASCRRSRSCRRG